MAREARVDSLADLEFVLVDDELLQVALHPGQSLINVTVWIHTGSDLCCGSVLDGAVQYLGEGAHTPPHAGDISLDLAEDA